MLIFHANLNFSLLIFSHYSHSTAIFVCGSCCFLIQFNVRNFSYENISSIWLNLWSNTNLHFYIFLMHWTFGTDNFYRLILRLTTSFTKLKGRISRFFNFERKHISIIVDKWIHFAHFVNMSDLLICHLTHGILWNNFYVSIFIDDYKNWVTHFSCEIISKIKKNKNDIFRIFKQL